MFDFDDQGFIKGKTCEVRIGTYEGGPGFQLYDGPTGEQWSVFGIPSGGATPEETVAWGERFQSKQGVRFIRPDGWEKVVGKFETDRREDNREAFEAGFDAASSLLKIARDRLSNTGQMLLSPIAMTIDAQRDEMVERWIES